MRDAALLSRGLRTAGVITISVVIATIVVAILEEALGHPDASPVYIVAVVVSAMLGGTIAGVGTAVASVLAYDLFFTAPTLTLHITDTGEWLSLVLLSFVAITVGQLVAIQRQRTEEALRREHEAEDLYAVSHALATRASIESALGVVADILSARAGLDRVWFGSGESVRQERVVADTGQGVIAPSAARC